MTTYAFRTYKSKLFFHIITVVFEGQLHVGCGWKYGINRCLNSELGFSADIVCYNNNHSPDFTERYLKRSRLPGDAERQLMRQRLRKVQAVLNTSCYVMQVSRYLEHVLQNVFV